jgi:D-lyxose ketol-isomerase
MKRSLVNKAISEASQFFSKHSWYLPPEPRWDVTDFGLNDFENFGLVLVNLCEEAEYCEKLMFAKKGMTTPCHAHKNKKEDIIVRNGQLAIQVWNGKPGEDDSNNSFSLKINGSIRKLYSGDILKLAQGERITLTQGIYHEFYPLYESTIIGEVSTANDDAHDNYFVNPDVGRFSEIIEDEPPLVKLVSDK